MITLRGHDAIFRANVSAAPGESKGHFKLVPTAPPEGELTCEFEVRGAISPPSMYQSFYGFKEMPFNITPDPRFLYLSPTHQEALQHLKYGVQREERIYRAGRRGGLRQDHLCRRFLNELDPKHYDTALILNPRVTETQMLKAILTELGETKLARSQVDLVAQMNKVLLERIEKGRDIVLIIDEAQNLSFAVLEQIRLLSNLETDKQKLLQIVLMGQPELKDVLAREELRQLRQRILVHYELNPLSLHDMQHYIQHRSRSPAASAAPPSPLGRSRPSTAAAKAFPGS
jgi:general secretion pathway protein A